MRVVCSMHGCQPCRRISLDLLDARGESTAEVVIVWYECDGTIVDAFFVSREFADAHGITGGVSQLPDEYPLWTRETAPVCERCFCETGPGSL